MTSAYLTLAALSSPSSFQFDAAADKRLAVGKAEVEKILAESTHGGSCWSKAVSDLTAGCRDMDDDQRSRLAVQFANCHLGKSGLATYGCTPEMSIEACTKPMVDSPAALAFQTYTSFLTHSDSMCFYLQSAAFQRSTEAAVDALHSSARGTAVQLASLQEQAGQVVGTTASILREQEAAAEAAQALLDGQARAAEELEALQEAQAASRFIKATASKRRWGPSSRSPT